jgi:hypothetical protein
MLQKDKKKLKNSWPQKTLVFKFCVLSVASEVTFVAMSVLLLRIMECVILVKFKIVGALLFCSVCSSPDDALLLLCSTLICFCSALFRTCCSFPLCLFSFFKTVAALLFSALCLLFLLCSCSFCFPQLLLCFPPLSMFYLYGEAFCSSLFCSALLCSALLSSAQFCFDLIWSGLLCRERFSALLCFIPLSQLLLCFPLLLCSIYMGKPSALLCSALLFSSLLCSVLL